MKKWQKFELSCFNYLKSKYMNKNFEYYGQSNSYESDIKVKKANREYFIEVKMCPSQAGQFVLTYDNCFNYSINNRNKISPMISMIIDYINSIDYKNIYNNMPIIFTNCENIFSDHIINVYNQKNVKFLITNNYKIFSLKDIKKYFNIKGILRKKKSGSSSITKKYSNIIIDYLKNNNYNDIIYNNKKIIVKTNKPMDKFSIGENNFIFSKKDENAYEIRKLSNTNNYTVIFTLTLK